MASAHRVQATDAACTPGQRDVQRLGPQLRLELGLRELVARGIQQRLDLLLGLVDLGATRLLGFGRERGQALEQFGKAAALAEEARLGVFEFGRGRRGVELGAGLLDERVEVVHERIQTGEKKGRPRR